MVMFHRILIITAAFLIIIVAVGQANDKAGEEINWQVISSGGTINGESDSYKLSGTVAQTATGSGTSDNYGLSHGFWQEFPAGGEDCCDFPGDAKNDGNCNILDITYLISFLYKGGPPPPCLNEGDVNHDCLINILDITNLIAFLYKDGPAPVCGCVE